MGGVRGGYGGDEKVMRITEEGVCELEGIQVGKGRIARGDSLMNDAKGVEEVGGRFCDV